MVFLAGQDAGEQLAALVRHRMVEAGHREQIRQAVRQVGHGREGAHQRAGLVLAQPQQPMRSPRKRLGAALVDQPIERLRAEDDADPVLLGRADRLDRRAHPAGRRDPTSRTRRR